MYMKGYYEHGEFFGAAINSKSLRGASKFGIEIRNVMICYEFVVFAFWWSHSILNQQNWSKNAVNGCSYSF